MSSSNLPLRYNGSSITLLPVCSGSSWSHLSIRPLFPPLLCCYFFPLLPSFPSALWQPGSVRSRLREPKMHVVQGRRWGTRGMGPLAKTTSPAVAWCLPLPTDLSPRYFTLPPKIHLWIIPSFHSSLSPQPLTKSPAILFNLKWKLTQINCGSPHSYLMYSSKQNSAAKTDSITFSDNIHRYYVTVIIKQR